MNWASARKLSKAQRDALRRLGPAIDAVCESDKLFFQRFPHRRHRLRRARRVEIEQHAAITNLTAVVKLLQTGSEWYALVKMVAPDAWIRLLVVNQAGLDIDNASEQLALALFKLETMNARELLIAVETSRGSSRDAQP